MARIVDHIVYCVPDLGKALVKFENLLGVKPSIGGKHLTKGTKNALLNLGNQCYLEVLAADHENHDFIGDRWMGIDLLQSPKITRWSVKAIDIEADSKVLKNYSSDLGQISKGSRQTTSGSFLSWQMTLPSAFTEVEVIPFITDWSDSTEHPTDTMNTVCALKKVTLFHPNPESIYPTLTQLGIEVEVCQKINPGIQIEIQTPKGVIVLM